jgi:hypothetical protein
MSEATHYQIRKRVDKGQVLFDMVYVDWHLYKPSLVRMVTPCAESPEELRQDLADMLADSHRYPILVDPEEPTL